MTTTKTPALRAALYGRKSSEDKARPGKSVRDQLREARAEAKRRGYTVAPEHVFEDDAISASRFAKGKVRPGYIALVNAIGNREIDVLVLAQQSRAARMLSTIGALAEMCAEAGIRMVIDGRDIDPSNPTDMLLIGVQGGMDAAESQKISDQTQRGMRGAAVAGKPAGRNVYGYSRTYDPRSKQLLAVEPVPAEAAIVQEVTTRVLAGDPLYAIAQDLNARGVPSPYDAVAVRVGREPKGALWAPTQVRRCALSPVYAGIRQHKDREYDAMWPAIIDPGQHERAVALLTKASRRTNTGNRPGAIVHWLSGVAKCGVDGCGTGMRVTVNRRVHRTYLCAKCFGTARVAQPLEDYVEAYIFEIAADPAALRAIAASQSSTTSKDAIDRLNTLNARRDSVRSLVIDGTMPPQDGAEMLTALSLDIDAAEAAVRQIALPRDLGDIVTPDLPANWSTYSPARKREIADNLVDVVVLPMNGRKTPTFDPDFVRVTIKGS